MITLCHGHALAVRSSLTIRLCLVGAPQTDIRRLYKEALFRAYADYLQGICGCLGACDLFVMVLGLLLTSM
jgi:hypothetical protein